MNKIYSFRCKYCGATKIDENVAIVENFKREHKKKPCTLVPTKRNTLARPELLPYIEQEIDAKNKILTQ
jgi:hypothetical protein